MYIFPIFWLIGIVCCEPTIYLREEFPTENSFKNWIQSRYKGSQQGKFRYSAGKYYNNAQKDKGIQTSEDAKFYGISYKLKEPFTNKNKTLVIQFQVKHEQNLDCGGGYIKVMGSNFVQESFHGDTPYEIMFGPDICGLTIKKVHVILHYKGENYNIKREITAPNDEFSHLYTLIINPDNTFKVLIDNERAESGNLEDEWEFLEQKKIFKPYATKPAEWDDNESIPDPDDIKPDDWDLPETILDSNAIKPEDWDNQMDGEWEAPRIPNPHFRGEWKPKEIHNPNYQGPWMHPEIDNPDYVPDPELYLRGEIGAVGFDLWQVKSGTIFDNILLTDDPAYAKRYAEKTWTVAVEGERIMRAKVEERERKSEEDKKKTKPPGEKEL